MSESKSHNIANYFSVKQEMLASYGSFSKKARGPFFAYWKNVTLLARVTEEHPPLPIWSAAPLTNLMCHAFPHLQNLACAHAST